MRCLSFVCVEELCSERIRKCQLLSALTFVPYDAEFTTVLMPMNTAFELRITEVLMAINVMPT